MRFYTLLLLLSFFGIGSLQAFADTASDRIITDTESYYLIDPDHYFLYEDPSLLHMVLDAPVNVGTWLKQSFRQENARNIAGIVASTAFLCAIDQQIIDAAQDFGRDINLSGENNIKPAFYVAGYPAQFPTDLSSGLYFIGDGWTHLTIAASFASYGGLNDDRRALQTGSQITEGLISVTIVTQFLKHVTGRQSPFKSTEPGGRWIPFPDQIKYYEDVPSYDAYPSGHMAASMVTLTVIAENYPEYRYIRPVGYTLMTLLGYQMLNNGVHWASDYPLSLAMAYGIGKIVVAKGRKIVPKEEISLLPSKPKKESLVLPIVAENTVGAVMIVRY